MYGSCVEDCRRWLNIPEPSSKGFSCRDCIGYMGYRMMTNIVERQRLPKIIRLLDQYCSSVVFRGFSVLAPSYEPTEVHALLFKKQRKAHSSFFRSQKLVFAHLFSTPKKVCVLVLKPGPGTP